MIPPSVKLTEKQMAVFKAFCGGKLQKEIALDLGVKANTIGSHMKQIRKKFGVRTNRQLFAMTTGDLNVSAELSILRADAAGFEAWRKKLVAEISLVTAQRDAALRELKELRDTWDSLPAGSGER